MQQKYFGDCKTDSLTICLFSGVGTLFSLQGGFRLSADRVALKFLTQSSIVFFDQEQGRACSVGNDF